MWNWYIASDHELMCDIDDNIAGAEQTRLVRARARLAGAVKNSKLDMADAWLYPSGQLFHYHMIVRLNSPMSAGMRIIWQLRLMDDVYRVCASYVRVEREVRHPVLLISDMPYRGFYRNPDYVCSCPGKHLKEVFRDCPVAIKLRDNARVDDYFGVPIDKQPMSPVKFGRMDL